MLGAPGGRSEYDPLNESPSEKEGKSPCGGSSVEHFSPSMKVPPKRKGNYSKHYKQGYL